MHAKTYLITAGLAALQPVAADFKIFLGAQNNYSGGGDPTVGPVKGSTDQAYFFNNPPSCSDHGGVLQVDGNSDVSWSLGFVCDGCTDAPPVPDRLEIHDGDGTFFDNAGDEPHFSTYLSVVAALHHQRSEGRVASRGIQVFELTITSVQPSIETLIRRATTIS